VSVPRLLGAFESAGEEVVHHQGGDVGRDLEVLLRILRLQVQAQIVAPVDQAGQQLVDPVFLFVGPLAGPSSSTAAALAQIRRGLRPAVGVRPGGEELFEVVVVEIRIRILVELAFPCVVGLELEVEAVEVGNPIGRLVDRRFAASDRINVSTYSSFCSAFQPA